jgi:hypothetical protein
MSLLEIKRVPFLHSWVNSSITRLARRETCKVTDGWHARATIKVTSQVLPPNVGDMVGLLVGEEVGELLGAAVVGDLVGEEVGGKVGGKVSVPLSLPLPLPLPPPSVSSSEKYSWQASSAPQPPKRHM